MKVLVTGGAGFIGSHIVDALLQQGDRPVVVDNLSTGSLQNLSADVPLYEADITNGALLEQIFEEEQPDIVCHHAAQMDVRKSMHDPSFDAQVNIIGSLNVIALTAKYRVQKLIFASTSAVYSDSLSIPSAEDDAGQPISAYGIAKFTVEKYLRLYHENCGLSYTALRYGNVFGPRQNPHGEAGVVAIFTQQILSGIQPTIFGDGSKTRDYIAVKDVVRANLVVMNGKGKGTYNIGHGIEVSDFEIFDAIRTALDAHIQPSYKARRPGELNRVCLDCRKAQSELGWIPKIPVHDGIAATVKYHLTRSEIRQLI
jgi:UDP-glucose 4-epimerase